MRFQGPVERTEFGAQEQAGPADRLPDAPGLYLTEVGGPFYSPNEEPR